MRRREFIGSLGGAAVFSVWRPAVIKTQQPGRPRRIAILMGVREGDPEGAGRYAALVAGLKERGWIDGDTAKLETWWAGGSIARIREIVPELVASAPDIIVGNGTAVTGELHEATRTIRAVFKLTADPVGLGYIERTSRPGANLTGFIFFEPPLIGKWFDLLRQVSPGVAQTTLLFNPGTASFYFRFFEGQPGLGTGSNSRRRATWPKWKPRWRHLPPPRAPVSSSRPIRSTPRTASRSSGWVSGLDWPRFTPTRHLRLT